MSTLRDRIRMWFGEPGESLPSDLLRDHRGMFFNKRASGSEDELYLGMVDSSDAMQTRRILTKTYADTIYPARKSTATGWTSAVGAAMGSSPGAITQSGAEYTGRVVADSGSSGTTAGILFTITFATARANSNYNIFINPQNLESARCNPYGVNTSTTQFTISAQVAPNVSTQIRIGWLIEDKTP